ncbi:MAG: hypothetical protein K2L82_05230 [Lachnospiraceae bacterium]|nr:hypothetical protein [Lachnospiraceae bacterium]
MEERELKELNDKIRDADLVLVGLGEELQYDWNALTQDQRYQEIEEEIGGREEYIWIVPFLQKMILKQLRQDKWRTAYKNLSNMIAGKNYFIVSLCMDDYVYDAGILENRIVTPCGGLRLMQCNRNCSHVLNSIPQGSYDAVLRYYNKELGLKDMQEPVCENCGDKLRFNQLGVNKYAEEGYLDCWNEYTKWLQGTVNKRLCILELGVGMEYPAIIRFPFEKIVFYNQKSFICRVHSTLYQLGEEIGDRGRGIKDNPVDFLCRLECT